MTLAVYDPAVYEYGSSTLVCRAGPDDVAFLNELQAAYAFNALYVDPVRMPTGTLEALVHGPKNGRSAYSRDLTKVQGPGRLSSGAGLHRHDAQLPRGESHLADQPHRGATSMVVTLAEGAGTFSEPDTRRIDLSAVGSATECAAIYDMLERRRSSSGSRR